MSNLAHSPVALNRFPRFVLLGALFATQLAYGLSVSLNPSLPSPQPVGQNITLTAVVPNPSAAIRYRFMIQPPGTAGFNMLAEYQLSNSLQWSELPEGVYEIQIDAVNIVTGATASVTVPFQFTSRVTGNLPVVSASANPLVAIYSAPSCSQGTIDVMYHVTGDSNLFFSNSLPCQPGASNNFFIGGMRAQTSYTMRYQVVNNGKSTWGPPLMFTSGAINYPVPAATVAISAGPSTSMAEGIVLQSYTGLKPNQGFGGEAYGPTAYNLAGQVVWYYAASNPNGTYLTRPVAGGTFLIYDWTHTADATFVQEIDLQGDILRETNTYTISQQLTAMQQPTINWLSHEAVRLANGHTLVLGMTERVLNNVQGPGAVDVVGDMIIDLDQNFQVAWVWNTFDHLPNNRVAPLGELCVNGVAPCGVLKYASQASDWTHCNSLYLLPDGSLILSVRNQDWVVKINYQNGTGDGRILWTLGNLASQAGTPYFTLQGGVGPWPWFSHQHDVEFDGTNYEMLDNGNTRVSAPPLGIGSGHSRGQVYSLNEISMVASPVLSVDLGRYSGGYGSAQLLANGDYWFSLGFLSNGGFPLDLSQEVITTNPSSDSYFVSFPSSAYRSFRLSSFYTYSN